MGPVRHITRTTSTNGLPAASAGGFRTKDGRTRDLQFPRRSKEHQEYVIKESAKER